MAKSISQRIKADRGPAGCFGFIAAIPGLALVGGVIWVFIQSLTHQEEPADLIFSGVVILFGAMFWLVTSWSYSAARSAMTPQRVQAMWLRRFQSEKGDAFRPSRVIDRLSRHGVSAITLQDRDVKLSFEQRRNRLGPMFWFLFAPIGAFLAYCGFAKYSEVKADIANQHIEYSSDLGEAFGQAIGQGLANGLALAFVIIIFLLAIIATTVLIFVFAAISGPLGAMFSSKRDDFQSLPRLLQRLKRGKGRRGASIVRISDAHWREAVTSSIAAVDVAIIDLSDVSQHVAWEIGEAVKGVGAAGLVFISREGAQLSDEARSIVRNALGQDPSAIVYYPTRQGRDAKRFERALREQIYNAADISTGTKSSR